MGSMTKFYLINIIASLVFFTHALPTREEVDRLLNRLVDDEARELAMYDQIGVRNLDALGGGNLRRDTRAMDSLAGLTFGGLKRFDSLSGLTFGGQKRSFGPLYYNRPSYEAMSRAGLEMPEISSIYDQGSKTKKNFDEIDHANFDSFVKRDPMYASKGIKTPIHVRY